MSTKWERSVAAMRFNGKRPFRLSRSHTDSRRSRSRWRRAGGRAASCRVDDRSRGLLPFDPCIVPCQPRRQHRRVSNRTPRYGAFDAKRFGDPGALVTARPATGPPVTSACLIVGEFGDLRSGDGRRRARCNTRRARAARAPTLSVSRAARARSRAAADARVGHLRHRQAHVPRRDAAVRRHRPRVVDAVPDHPGARERRHRRRRSATAARQRSTAHRCRSATASCQRPTGPAASASSAAATSPTTSAADWRTTATR